MATKLALAGNPNSGKTTMFNDLTGSAQYVGNWPGVTVEKKEGRVKGMKDVIIQDLPGIYSLSPYTNEEVITRNYLLVDKPDAIIDIVDATNIERNLYLTTQLIELGLPVVIALNMMDIVRKSGDAIDLKRLGEALGCAVIETSALKGEGSREVAEKAAELAETWEWKPQSHSFGGVAEHAIAHIEDEIKELVDQKKLRWYTIKLFERDKQVLSELSLDPGRRERIEAIIAECERELDDDSESIITNERYEYITKVIKGCFVKKNKTNVTVSDKIDRLVTNRILALPIFAAVMFVIYYISISSVGGMMTDWVNDTLFGEIILPGAGDFLTNIGCAEWLNALITDGIIGGVGAVLGFLPQMAVLFLLLALLEDCGYMARIAFIMDRVFRKFGLSGKSFIPMLIATGCGVPGIMASRTIEDESSRRITIMTTTFMPCGAKLPVIALIAGAMFGGSAFIAFSAYFVGIASIITTGIIMKKLKAFAGEATPFVMELPAYHIPGPRNIFFHTWERSKAFVKKAGTIILVACIITWFLSNFNWSFQMVDAEDSILAWMGGGLAYIFKPLGWGDWRFAVSAVTGIVAKENLVGTLGVLFGFAELAEDGAEMWATFAAVITPLAAYSYLLFNLLCAPCFAAIGAIRREMNNGKWMWIALGFQTGFAFIVAFCVYQLGMLFTGGSFGFETALAFICAAVFFFLLFRPASKYSAKELKRAPGREKVTSGIL
ncbi:MAG: ferrous iron transport protein B [Oscillospiraceae bacterium]|jgi:ferrous iron transport protein B|nr:ferrous iron transport protein B [Oscillospiraceae bacterium]